MDAFSKRHPAVNFLFFVGVFVLSVVVRHPLYQLMGLAAGTCYYFLLRGSKGLKTLLWLLPTFVLLTLINPLLNTLGETPLFHIFGRPYTLEALLYGGALAVMFVTVMLWFGCYNQVLTSDKFTALFGSWIPSISLLLVMVLRLIPNLIRKAGQLMGARRSIGKGAGEDAGFTEKIKDGTGILGALTGWALEGSVVTGDSMRCRGYGTGKRTSFMRYRMTGKDWGLLAVVLGLLALAVTALCLGQAQAQFVPQLQLAGCHWGLAAYGAYLLIPIVLHIKEAIQWRISRSGI